MIGFRPESGLWRWLLSLGLLAALLACTATSGRSPLKTAEAPLPSDPDPIAGLISSAPPPAPTDRAETGGLEKMGFSVQVGAFSKVTNAARLEASLDREGLDAYYFKDSSGLFKVRFGNHGEYAAARSEAERLQAQGVIDRFFIVIPESYRAAQISKTGQGDLRQELVRTARQFLGVPYLWGGETRNGFDCSGLTMVCYRLNGLNLPRNSRAQFAKGRLVKRAELHQGDLVFFSPQGGKRISHVGLYIGQGQFIHAPRTGKTVRVANLSSPYWMKAFRGGRSYL